MKTLVINSGSSSVKFQLFDMPSARVLVKGLVDSIGLDSSAVIYETDHQSRRMDIFITSHQEALAEIVSLLLLPDLNLIQSLDEVGIVAHRVVHGGPITKTVQIDQEVKAVIRKYAKMAPLHNPPNLLGIEVAEKAFVHAVQVAVFDTAFHTSIPKYAHQFAIPRKLYDEEHIRVYGFHGTSHAYVYNEYSKQRPQKAEKVISLHLGNGCSATAIKNGKSVDHSLGFTPLSGLVMGTRSGDLDPSVVLYMAEKLNLSLDEVNNLLNKKSGMLGLTGCSDLREIEDRANQGEETCQIALDLATYRIKKYIGAYAAAMNGLNAIIFTGGIGENSTTYRKLICADMDYLGINLNAEQNIKTSKSYHELQENDEKVIISVIKTNEELAIASQAFALINEEISV